MYVLSEDIGRRAHLVIVHLVVTGHQVRVPEFDVFSAVGAEEERLRRAAAVEGRRYVVPQAQPSLLRVMPALFVQYDITLEDGGFITARIRDRVPVIVDIRPGEGTAGSRRQTVQDEVARLTIGLRL